ncbi:hypothetical protein COOONC_10222 [Cooperia oncophora]
MPPTMYEFQRLSLINCSIVPRFPFVQRSTFVVVVHYNYTILFSVGRPGSLNHQRIIEEESALYDDILQFDFNDTYRNLTLKVLFSTH